jgi:small-conductance mechanosensitive channel
VILRPVTRRTESKLDERILEKVSPHLRWLPVVIAADLAADSLTFVPAGLKSFSGDVWFVLGLAIVVHGLWRAIDVVGEWYGEQSVQADREKELAPAINLSLQVARVVLAIAGTSTLLAHFGVNVTALAAALGLGGLAVSLAAKDTIADTISGFIILVDQPFRVGDRIETEDTEGLGEVIEIGLRSTRIRTWKNCLVIVPNSRIGHGSVLNYTYPDLQYQVRRYVGVARGTDVETVRAIITNTVRQVEGVLVDKAVTVRYDEIGDAFMRFAIYWWVESCVREGEVADRVNTALQRALGDAGIETSPAGATDVNLQVQPETVDRLARTIGGQS